MKVTALKRQKKHLTLVLFEDGGEILIDNDVCADFAVKSGCDIAPDKIEELLYCSEYARAKSRALWYLDRADRTEKAMFKKLTDAGFDKRASAAVIARFCEVGLIDDRRFAENFAARCADADISARETVRKLVEKGVPSDLAKEVVSECDTDEYVQIRAVIEKKYARKLTAENGVQKVYAALIRKGFSFSAVRDVLKKYSEELEYSEE